jgi:hypothetical protein
MRIRFRGNKTFMQSDSQLNTELDITDFVKYLAQFDIWSGYAEVPEPYYQSWKILILGSSEYDRHAFDIIKIAQEKWIKGGYNGKAR